MMETLFGSTIRAKILGWFLTHSEERYFVRQLSHLLQEDPTNVSRELSRLAKLGIFVSEQEGNLKYYKVNTECAFYPELRGLVLKTVGVAGILKQSLMGLAGVQAAFIYGSFADGTETATSDVDLIVVGEVDQNRLDEILSDLETRLGRTVNYVFYGAEEFSEKQHEADGFLAQVLNDNKIMLIGNVDGSKGT